MHKSLLYVAAGILTINPVLSNPVRATPIIHLQAGLWQVNTQLSMPGLPIPMKPRVTTRCVTARELEDPIRAVLHSTHGQCTISDIQIEATTATWSLACKEPIAMTGTGRMSYTRTEYEGSLKMEMERRNGQMPKASGIPIGALTQFSGKRLGDCH